MSHYIVGSDRSGKSDNDCIEKVCQILRDNGHTADNIGVNSNLESPFRSKGKGCIGVFLVNGICIGTVDSITQGVVKKGIMDYWFLGVTKSYYGGGMNIPDELTTKKVPIAHDDNFTPEPRRSELNGKYTLSEYCSENSDYVAYAYGDDCEQVAQAILQGGGGQGGGGTGSTDKKKEPTPMSYLDMIKDLISVWDGDVECKIRQNKVYINKVPKPNPRLWVIEGNNIVSGQAKVTDYNSDTINSLDVTYSDKTINIKDEYLLNRFGEVSATLEAVKTITEYGNETVTENTSSSSPSSNEYTEIVTVLQKYYEADDWNTFTNNIRNAKTWKDVQNVVTSHKKKKGMENVKHNEIIKQLCDIKNIGY